MPFDLVQIAGTSSSWGALSSLVRSDGTAAQRFARRLRDSIAPLRDLADAVHHICMLHGRHPGVIDHAAQHTPDPIAKDWIEAAAQGFAAERAYMVRLVAAAGPLPSTPGQAESEAAVTHQLHALEMLAQSDRIGCASGAALALGTDWVQMRAVLDVAADRLGLAPPALHLPLEAETATIVDALAREASVERAMLFGAQQLLAQHRGLWDLLEARASARDRH